jgi:hypothetical protein
MGFPLPATALSTGAGVALGGWAVLAPPVVLAMAMALVERIRELSRASRPLTKKEVDEVVRLGELAKDVLRESAERLVRNAGPAPVLFQYQGDGTPQLVRQRMSRSWDHTGGWSAKGGLARSSSARSASS